MSEIRRSALFGKLNPIGLQIHRERHALLQDARQPVRGTRPLAAPDPVHDRTPICTGSSSNFGLDPARVAADLIAALDKLPRGATAISNFSPHLEEAIERGWLYASMLFNAGRVRTGHLVIGMLKTPGLKNVFLGLVEGIREDRRRHAGGRFRQD